MKRQQAEVDYFPITNTLFVRWFALIKLLMNNEAFFNNLQFTILSLTKIKSNLAILLSKS